jgi:hypothetical protein
VVEAHLLLGLIDYDWPGYQDLIEKSASNLLKRFNAEPYSITVNYPPLYLLYAVQRLLAALGEQPCSTGLQRHLEEARHTLQAQLKQEQERPVLTPQEAAFLSLTSLETSSPGKLNPAWLHTLLKNQLSDGSWRGETFFFVPNRGEVLSWYSSNTMTSAFCYQALKRYLKRRQTTDDGSQANSLP